MFAWDAYDRGTSVHLQAEPTKLELLQKNFSVKKDKFKNELQDSILSKVNNQLTGLSIVYYLVVACIVWWRGTS